MKKISMGTVLCRVALLALFFMPAFWAPCALAQAGEDVFTVSGVKIDAKAENAVAARKKAFEDAQIVAFTALAKRLLGAEDAKNYKIPDTATISTMIKDFEITNERVSPVEYIGTYTFRFDGPAVRQRFNMQGLRYSAIASKPVLVLPFFQQGSRTTLWGDDNPWLQAWGRDDSKGGLVPLVVPIGDAQDIAAIADDQTTAIPQDNLAAILARYNAGGAVILLGRPGPVGTNNVPADFTVMLYHTGSGTPQYMQTIKIMPDAGADVAALYDKAVRLVRAALQNGWKQQTAYNPEQGTSAITLVVNYVSMPEWIAVRQALQGVQGVTDLKIQSVTPRQAHIAVQYRGDLARFRLALGQANLVLGQPVTAGGDEYALWLQQPAPALR